MTTNAHQRPQLYSLVVVFFFWGFVAASNGIFIPFCKAHFSLSQFQSQLIDFTFYGGYFIGSILLFILSRIFKTDLLNKIGYKKGIIYGLLISVVGALSIIPSVNEGSFQLILCSFFIVALGFSLQQTASNPYVVALGSSDTGAHRLNLAGGVNSFGTTIGPIIVSYVLFGSLQNANAANTSIGSIKELYLIMAGIFAAMALFFTFSKLPNVKNDEIVETGFGALKYPQLVLGMVAIFMYVGVEVTIQSNMGALLKLPDFGGYDEAHISQFISLYWGSLMIGRWTGAISVFRLNKTAKMFAFILVPYFAFMIILFVNYLHGNDLNELFVYAFCVALLIIANFIGKEKQARTLMVFALFGLAAMLVGLMSTGKIALYSFISGGLFCSVMWPCIFSLAISGLGKHTSQGSAFLIMMILGGAIIPPLQGKLADSSLGIHASYIITLFCFAYLAFFALRARSILKQQGIDEDKVSATAH